MLAVFVNCAAIILGSIIGLLFSRKITRAFSETITIAAGVVTLVLGFQMAFEYKNVIYLTLSLIIGGLLGSWWDIDRKILSFGSLLERKLYFKKLPAESGISPLVAGQANRGTPSFAYAFLNASVLFCVGAMAIVGSFKAGIDGDNRIIFTKSVLDGFMAIVFAAAMGLGTAFSVFAVFLYQGLLTLAAGFVSPWVTELMLNEISAIGGCLIVMIGINLLNFKKIKTANYLPAMAIIIVFQLVDGFIQKLF